MCRIADIAKRQTSASPLLYSSTFMFFRDFPEMNSFVQRTFDLELWRIGSLIQLKEADAFRILNASPDEQYIVRRELAVSGLRFGDDLGWVSPEDIQGRHILN